MTTELLRLTPKAPPTYWEDWRESAACAGLTWMAERGRTEEAREVCRSCPVFVPCRTWIMNPNTPVVAGVVAGLSPAQRGLVECACGALVTRTKSRDGKCWTCYLKAKR